MSIPLGSLGDVLVPVDASLRDAMVRIDRSGRGIVLVVDAERRLLGSVTDGDLRRAVLAGTDLGESLAAHLRRRAEAGGRAVVTARDDAGPDARFGAMTRHGVRHLPVVDAEGRVVSLAELSDFAAPPTRPLRAVVMAGGAGRRLLPLTASVPKPMLPLDDRPVLEHAIARLREAGVEEVDVAVHHLPEAIERHFGDGREFGVRIRYLREERPLGTAGALSRVETDDEPLLVWNGDVVTRVNVEALRHFHDEHASDLTVAVHTHRLTVPYGVLDLDGPAVRGIREKPSFEHFVSAGITLVGPRTRALVPTDTAIDMPDVVRLALEAGLRVVAFPLREYWIDVGRVEDYERARAEAAQSRADD